MIQFSEFKKFFIGLSDHSELEVCFHGVERRYMLIKYENHVSFQRCGMKDGSGEFEYGSLDELYRVATVDGICLEKDWARIECVIARTSTGCFYVDDAISRD